MRLVLVLATLAIVLVNSTVYGWQKSPEASPPTTPAQTKNAESPDTPPQPAEELSTAERISRLQRAIESDQERIGEAKKKQKDLAQEFDLASSNFKDLDTQFEQELKDLEKLRDADQQQEADELAKTNEDTKKKRLLAKERFDLAIEQQKVAQAQLAALEEKLKQDQQALEKLTAPPTPTTKPPKTEEAMSPQDTSTQVPTPGVSPPLTVAPTVSAPAVTPLIPPTLDSNGLTLPAETVEPAPTAPKTPEVEAASREAQAKAKAAEAAEETAVQVTERLKTLDKTIELEREGLNGARKLADNAQATLDALVEEYQKALDSGAAAAVVQEIRQKMLKNQSRLRDLRADARIRANQLDDRQSERAALLAEQMTAMRKAELERAAAETARRDLEFLTSPFAPTNMMIWLSLHGTKIAVIVMAGALFLWMVRLFGRRTMNWLVHSGERGSKFEREKRANTLVSVFQNTATVVVYTGGLLMILQEVGVPIVPLLGGAAVAGLAVAFGAQNLVKDYFSGFMILLENQYGVNDIVTIAGITGQVERVTLRITVLRDLEGTAHFIPHSAVTTVSNQTHVWSRSVFNVGVAYKENVDQVMQVLTDLANELREDPEFGHHILGAPEMLGVDKFEDSAVVIRFMLKSRPLMQWALKREMNRRIKNRFDELGIEIPFPQRTVYHRHEENSQHIEVP